MKLCILYLRAWYWEVRCFNYWLSYRASNITRKAFDSNMEVLSEHRRSSARDARMGWFIGKFKFDEQVSTTTQIPTTNIAVSSDAPSKP